jgi:hypothetical protein
MKRLAVLLLIISTSMLIPACSSIKKTMPVSIDPGVSVQTPQVSVPVGGGLSASGILEGDEYMVADHDRDEWLNIGKLLTPPSQVSREAEFLVYQGGGQKKWTSAFYKVRPATAADIKAGTEVIYFRDNYQEEVYRLPNELSSARNGSWRRALVTDVSLYASRGVVYVGDERVDKNNVFVVAAQQ